jgi:phosphate starvation-inducible PhoH-like protein
MKTLLTRIGENSKFILSGDLEQSDRYRDPSSCGLADALDRLKDVDGVGIFQFGIEDVVRNPLVGRILEQYKDIDH